MPRDDFGPDSDLDVLVRFKPGRTPGLFVAARIRSELADIEFAAADDVARRIGVLPGLTRR